MLLFKFENNNFSLLKKIQRLWLYLQQQKKRLKRVQNFEINLFCKCIFKSLFPNKVRRQSYLIFSVDKQTQSIFRNNFRFPWIGFLSCFSYSLTPDTKHKLEWCFPCTCRAQRSLTGFLCSRKPTL